ncbi:hypothetical protein [Sphingomonas hylomeconis]|uniref:Uncharacterized protein n=1 Tax=Sphingomonas hylomeconis TaxID=1395958 RepID=A0ABV7STV7_9SPHN|nr:hypothetical protein [Sphingomonas hylomeconis]
MDHIRFELAQRSGKGRQKAPAQKFTRYHVLLIIVIVLIAGAAVFTLRSGY